MARRRATKRKTPRRRSTSLNLVNTAQTYLQTAIITRAAFNVNPIEFVTGQQSITGTKTTQVPVGNTGYSYGVTTTGTTTGYQPLLNGSAITLPELFGAGDKVGFGATGGWADGSPMEAVRANIMLNGGYFKPIYQTVVLNAGFAIGKKVFSKQLGLVRKGLKLGGLAGMVKV
mgnify:FL=1|tara:strand:+ start:839 stop:1357 length:519 start_codon:yes stop_codon:yes gene_type:complete